MSFHFSVSNVLVLMLTVQAALATVVERQRRAVFESTHETAEEMRRDQIFQRPLSSEPWTKILGNPCRSPRPPPEGSLPENFHTLDLSGRLMEVYRLAGHMTSRLRHMKEDMPSTLCPGQRMTSMPPPLNVSTSPSDIGFDNQTLLAQLYDHFYLLAGHAHFMMTDWQHGSGCTNRDGPITAIIRRTRDVLRMAMCTLMVSGDPNPIIPPYPSPEMLAAHQRMQQEQLWHYRDCTARRIRDCVVVEHGLVVFGSLFERAKQTRAAKEAVAAAAAAAVAAAAVAEAEDSDAVTTLSY